MTDASINPVHLPLPVLVALVLVLLVTIALSSRVCLSRSKGDTVLLLGPSHAGKTVLYYRLKDGSTHTTVPSLKENDARFVPTSSSSTTPIRFVDLPGHASQRHQLPRYTNSTRAIVYLIDATDTSKLPTVAQSLFSLLTDRTLRRKRVPVLLALNKYDLVSNSTSSDSVISAASLRVSLESLLEKSRQLQSSMPDLSTTKNGATDGDSEGSTQQLGREGEAFRFEHSEMPITIATMSAKTGDIEAVLRFVQ